MTATDIKSAKRCLQILELFTEVRRPLRLKEIVERLDCPVSSMAALLKCMSEFGYLAFDRIERTYVPTARVAQIGSWIMDDFDEQKILQAMENLQRKSGELVMLAMANDIYVQIIRVFRAVNPIQFYTEAGTRHPLVRSCFGWLLLARLSDDAIKKIYTRTVREGELKEADLPLSRLFENIRQTRQQGFGFQRGLIITGVSAIAMLVPSPTGRTQLGISIAGPTDRIEANRKKLIAELMAEVGLLSQGVNSTASK
jgi:IclR family KDG regulon transcriptional repressor